jgi:proline utilization trans-activator
VARPAASLLPSEEDARSCLEAVAFHLGESQHYIDLRIFSDTLDNIYEGGQSAHGVAPLAPLQLVEVMLVLALGQQILRMELPGEMLPGEGLFKGAITRLPPFSEMKRIGIPMVSILALAAIYFQNLDMPEDAHFYVRIHLFLTKDRFADLDLGCQSSTALRIVLINKMHRRASSAGLPRSRRLHLNRLWWTVYMQERYAAYSNS